MELRQAMFRVGVQRDLAPGASVMLGYAQVPTFDAATTTWVAESRIFQQAIVKHRLNRVHLTHRFRLEERWISDQTLRLRLRYFALVNLPLRGTELRPGIPYVTAYNEFFVVPNGGMFDRNRLYVGFGYCLSPTLRADLGLMAQTALTSTQTQWNLILHHSIPYREK
jgi:hypothetical protein